MTIRLADISLLVVEDNEFMVEIITTLLRGLGIDDIRTAVNGQRAIALIKEFDFDVILTDWRMPVMDGGKLVQWVRKHKDSPNPEIPVILVTGINEREEIISARDVGITEFIVKPLNSDVLRNKILAVLRNDRPFIESENYVGPCRRRRRNAPYFGDFRRESDFSTTMMVAEDHPIFAARLDDLVTRSTQLVNLLNTKDKSRHGQLLETLNRIGDLGIDYGVEDAFAISQLAANLIVVLNEPESEDRKLLRSLLDTIKYVASGDVDATHQGRVVRRVRGLVSERVDAARRKKKKTPHRGAIVNHPDRIHFILVRMEKANQTFSRQYSVYVRQISLRYS